MKERRHVAIMFTDIVGYTALMGSDEDKAFDMLKRNHEIHEHLIKQFNGTLIKEVGDGTLASFPLASDAVRCAIEIQREAVIQQIPLKIGIHQGEMVFEGTDVLGDGVNVASRLQELSDEGCISISGAVYRDVKNKPGIVAEFVKEEILKNVDEPVKVYQVHCEEEVEELKSVSDQKPGKSRNWVPYYIITGLVIVVAAMLIWQIVPTREAGQPSLKAPVDRVISIAVLPFDNLSGDPEQEYMCDGLTEEIINHLSQIRSLNKVIARTSMMKFKNTDILLAEIAEILDVNYILVGSYRQSGDKLRIAAQLIDPATEDIKWSDSYDRSLDDILDIQSDIARNIVAALDLPCSYIG